MTHSFLDTIIVWVLGIVTGFILGYNYVNSQELTPIEDNLMISCVKVGSDLKYYTLDGELGCENGAKFIYEIK